MSVSRLASIGIVFGLLFGVTSEATTSAAGLPSGLLTSTPSTPAGLQAETKGDAIFPPLAGSGKGRKTISDLDATLGDPTHGSLARKMLRDNGRILTSFEKNLLQADVLLTSPPVTAALSSTKHISSRQLAVLHKTLVALKHNPAITMLKRRGLALKRHFATVAAYLRAVLGAPPVTAPPAKLRRITRQSGSEALDTSLNRIGTAMFSPAVHKTLTGARLVLLGPRGGKITRVLPPLVLASLMPPEKLKRLGARPKSARPFVATQPDSCKQMLKDTQGSVSPELRRLRERATSFGIEELIHFGKTLARRLPLIGKLAKYPLPTNTRKELELELILLSVGFGPPTVGATTVGVTFYESVVSVSESFVDWYHDYVAAFPAYLELTPANSTKAAGQAQEYRACAIDHFGTVVGEVTPNRFSISGRAPWSAGCDRNACQSTELGRHAVTGELGNARGYATLAVEAGDLAVLKIEPYHAEIAPGARQTYTVHGFDNWGNDLGALGPTTRFGSATLSISPSGGDSGSRCEADWCTAQKPGTYMVTSHMPSRDGVWSESATLVVNPATELPAGELYVPYRQQLHARVPVVPGSWRMVPGEPHDGPYYLTAEGELEGLARSGVYEDLVPSDLGNYTISTEAVGLDGKPVSEAFKYDVVVPSCSNCVIRDGRRTFTFVWDNPCLACTADLQHYRLLFEASLPGTPGQYTRYLMNLGLGWGCFESGSERCAGIYQFGDYGWGTLPGDSWVRLYYEFQEPPYSEVTVGEWTVAVEGL